MKDTLVKSIAYILAAVVKGFVAYYMFNGLVKQ